MAAVLVARSSTALVEAQLAYLVELPDPQSTISVPMQLVGMAALEVVQPQRLTLEVLPV